MLNLCLGFFMVVVEAYLLHMLIKTSVKERLLSKRLHQSINGRLMQTSVEEWLLSKRLY
jgi:uncharacterized membrane protein YvlD (DUF360 family)